MQVLIDCLSCTGCASTLSIKEATFQLHRKTRTDWADRIDKLSSFHLFQLTVADFDVYDNIDTLVNFDPDAMKRENYPNIEKLRNNVESVQAIKDYLSKRPIMKV